MSNTAKKLNILHQSGKTVFSTNELMLYWGIENKKVLYTQIARMKQKGFLIPIQRGMYTLSKEKVDELELACSIKTNSYVSFETVLTQHDVVHQWYDTYFLAADRNMTITNQYGKFQYRSLPEKILNNRLGIVHVKNYFTATLERAICDYFYKVGFQQLDDLSAIDKSKLIETSQIYNNKRLSRDIIRLAKLL